MKKNIILICLLFQLNVNATNTRNRNGFISYVCTVLKYFNLYKENPVNVNDQEVSKLVIVFKDKTNNVKLNVFGLAKLQQSNLDAKFFSPANKNVREKLVKVGSIIKPLKADNSYHFEISPNQHASFEIPEAYEVEGFALTQNNYQNILDDIYYIEYNEK